MSVRTLTGFLTCALALPALALASACEKAPAPPRNDNLASATVLTAAAQGRVNGSTIGATRQKGEPVSLTASTVWFRWRAPSNGAVTFTGSAALPVTIDSFTGPALGHLRPAGAVEDEGDDGESQQSFRVFAGTNYAIRVTSFSGTAFSLKWVTVSAPGNDTRTGATAISGSAGSLVTDATAATTETTDPKIDTLLAPATVWYQWTAPATGTYDFDTHGSRVNTLLGAYTNATPAAPIADSSGDCGSFFDVSTASIQFAATSGTSYLLMVAGTNDDDLTAASLGGAVQLNWRQATPAPVASGNDAFASATRISGNYGSVTGDTDGATAEAGEPGHEGIPARSSVWFSWTPTVTSDYILTALPDDEDACAAGLSVYTGSTVSTLRAVQSDDDESLLSAATPGDKIDISEGASADGYGTAVHLFAGTTYHIAADGLSFPGAFTLRWDILQAAPTIRSATPGNGSVGVIWSPPKNTSGSPRTGYYVEVLPVKDSGFIDASDLPDPQLLPVSTAFTTIHGLRNGTAYRVIVAAINGSGLGAPAISGTVTPKR